MMIVKMMVVGNYDDDDDDDDDDDKEEEDAQVPLSNGPGKLLSFTLKIEFSTCADRGSIFTENHS